MSGHTPGPWEVCLDIGVDGNINVFAPDEMGAAIALVDCRDHPNDIDQVPREVALVNARLIAAAPELLEALYVLASDRWVDLSLSEQATWLVKAKSAIAKAEGK